MATSTQPGTMGGYKARRPNVTIDDIITPELRAKRKEMTMEAKGEAATNKAAEEAGKDMGMAKGGSVSSRADGCAQRGKTKGTMVTMNRGGMAC